MWEQSTVTCVEYGGGDGSGKREKKSTKSKEVLDYAESLAKGWKIPGGNLEIPGVGEVVREVPHFCLSHTSVSARTGATVPEP